MRCEPLSNLDSLHFVETTSQPVPLSDGWLEVKVHAAGLDYEDVVVAMDLVPGDETAMGHKAAGVIANISPGAEASYSDLKVGDRIVGFGKGYFANRVRTTPSHVHRIADPMTFEQAATLSVVYITALHSLLDLGN